MENIVTIDLEEPTDKDKSRKKFRIKRYCERCAILIEQEDEEKKNRENQRGVNQA